MAKLFLTTCLVLYGTLVSAQPDGNTTDRQGKRNGRWIKKDVYGNVLYQGQFEHGTPVGEFTYFYKRGGKKAVIRHLPNSDSARAKLYFHKKGGLMAEGIFVNEKKEGQWKFYDRKGNLTSEKHYNNDKKNGKMRVYFNDGSISETAVYKAGKKEGPWKQYYKNGNLKLDASVHSDIRYEGKYAQFYENGKPKVKGEYVDGDKESSWYRFNKDGSIKIIIVYQNDKQVEKHPKNGTFDNFYFDELPRSEYTYENGEKHGPFKEWYHMGEWKTKEKAGSEMRMPDRRVEKLMGTQLKRKGRYVHGKLDGTIITYNKNGSVESKKEYEQGKPVE